MAGELEVSPSPEPSRTLIVGSEGQGEELLVPIAPLFLLTSVKGQGYRLRGRVVLPAPGIT
jgi:hypothetical protein